MNRSNNKSTVDGKTMTVPQCPICIETLQAPIRMLICGHNFCETCLEDMPLQFGQIRYNNLRLIPLTNILLKTCCLTEIF